MSFLDEHIDVPLVRWLENIFHQILHALGVPQPWANAGDVLLSVLVCFGTLAGYYLVFGRPHRKTRKQLEHDLRDAMKRVQELTHKLDDTEAEDAREIRIFMDGAFDMMHYGHMNAFRQGRSLGSYLVVGINSDESITECKGSAPVMNDEERTLAVEGCKFVDEVLPNCPYIMTDEYLKWVIETYKIDYVVHGDDPCIVNGKNVYETAVNLGKYRTIPRTEGVSTTDIVGRMLLLTKDHHDHNASKAGQLVSKSSALGDGSASSNFPQPASKFFTTGRMIRLFSQGHKEAPKGAKIVYLDGAFDMIHAGHMELIQSAHKLGDYLIVGLHNDTVVNANLGGNLPIMTLNERVLSVLGCHCVDDVLIDAPWAITSELIASLNISVVAHGKSKTGAPFEENLPGENEPDRHMIPKEMGIYKEVETSRTITVQEVVSRIQANEGKFRAKYQRKMEAEAEYYKERYQGTLKKKQGQK